MKSILIKDTTREEREQIVKQALWGSCGAGYECRSANSQILILI